MPNIVRLHLVLTTRQEGLPDIMPLEACYVGWRDSLQNLARLVEPELNREGGCSLKEQLTFAFGIS